MTSRLVPLAMLLAAAMLGACSRDTRAPADTASATDTARRAPLTGAGATFPYPIYARWFSSYAARTGRYINYKSIGSGGGIRQVVDRTVDFGASDRPLTDAEMAQAGEPPIVHIPTVVGAVAVVYNLPTLSRPLKLDGATTADLFAGRITNWGDPRLRALNADAVLPDDRIVVVYRTDPSGTSWAFTSWLALESASWRASPGAGDTVKWPVGVGAEGSQGVAAQVQQTRGAIGFVELTYATQSRLHSAALRNPAGAFVRPDVSSMAAAARAVVDSVGPDAHKRISLLDAPGADSYPIASFSWILVRQRLADAGRAAELRDFLAWAVRDGAPEALAMGYAPLPGALVPEIERRIASISAGPVP